ncbi:MAG: hypothetical protein GXO26_00890, partial [Crenarchaeota archaeon]|nr:hypothetical protein [Thermoproteota archaeon]
MSKVIEMKPRYTSADRYPENEWRWRGIVNPPLVGGGFSYKGELPILDYAWSTSINEEGTRMLDNKASSTEYQGQLYFGRGLKLNGVDQNVTLQTAERVGEFTMIATNATNARYNALSYNVFVYGRTVAFYETLADGSNVYYTHPLEST